MASQNYQLELGVTAVCTLWLSEGCIAPEDDHFHTIKEMHGLDLSRLLQLLEERVSKQFFT
jgi:hypothetical protein